MPLGKMTLVARRTRKFRKRAPQTVATTSQPNQTFVSQRTGATSLSLIRRISRIRRDMHLVSEVKRFSLVSDNEFDSNASGTSVTFIPEVVTITPNIPQGDLRSQREGDRLWLRWLQLRLTAFNRSAALAYCVRIAVLRTRALSFSLGELPSNIYQTYAGGGTGGAVRKIYYDRTFSFAPAQTGGGIKYNKINIKINRPQNYQVDTTTLTDGSDQYIIVVWVQELTGVSISADVLQFNVQSNWAFADI